MGKTIDPECREGSDVKRHYIIAPDGYIPNSVVRGTMRSPDPPEEEIDSWQLQRDFMERKKMDEFARNSSRSTSVQKSEEDDDRTGGRRLRRRRRTTVKRTAEPAESKAVQFAGVDSSCVNKQRKGSRTRRSTSRASGSEVLLQPINDQSPQLSPRVSLMTPSANLFQGDTSLADDAETVDVSISVSSTPQLETPILRDCSNSPFGSTDNLSQADVTDILSVVNWSQSSQHTPLDHQVQEDEIEVLSLSTHLLSDNQHPLERYDSESIVDSRASSTDGTVGRRSQTNFLETLVLDTEGDWATNSFDEWTKENSVNEDYETSDKTGGQAVDSVKENSCLSLSVVIPSQEAENSDVHFDNTSEILDADEPAAGNEDVAILKDEVKTDDRSVTHQSGKTALEERLSAPGGTRINSGLSHQNVSTTAETIEDNRCRRCGSQNHDKTSLRSGSKSATTNSRSLTSSSDFRQQSARKRTSRLLPNNPEMYRMYKKQDEIIGICRTKPLINVPV